MKKLAQVAGLSLALSFSLAAQQKAAGSDVTMPVGTKYPFAIAEKIPTDAIPNFGKVSPFLYRGGQPKENGIAELNKLGVKLIVNLREEDEADKEEKQRAEALGIRYVSIPWRGFDKPNDKQVAEFLQLLRANSETPVFVHCRRGAERTGVMVAAYRMAIQEWTPEQALEEMEEFKFRGFWFRHLKKYVRAFPENAKSNEAFKLPQPVAAGTTP